MLVVCMGLMQGMAWSLGNMVRLQVDMKAESVMLVVLLSHESSVNDERLPAQASQKTVDKFRAASIGISRLYRPGTSCQEPDSSGMSLFTACPQAPLRGVLTLTDNLSRSYSMVF